MCALAGTTILLLGSAPAVAATSPATAPVTVSAVPADAPFALRDRITDRADVLDEAALQSDLETLEEEHDIQLWVVFVDSFDGRSGDQWVQDTYEESGFGGNDVLLAVAVEDRAYGMWATEGYGVTEYGISRTQSRYVEPELGDDDWDGAVTAAAEGLGEIGDTEAYTGGSSSGGYDSGGGIFGGFNLFSWFPILFILMAVGPVAMRVVRNLRGLKDRQQPAPPPIDQPAGVMSSVPIDQLRRDVATALVDLDNAIRSSGEELAFAQAQFGEQATQQFTSALESARSRSAEAFRIQQELDIARGAGRLVEAEERARLAQILDLTRAADDELDAQEAEFTQLRDLEASVPQFLASLRTRTTEVEQRLPVARQELDGLGATHARSSLATLAGNLEQAPRLVEAARGFVTSGEQHLQADDRPSAVAAARAAEDALGQADALVDAVLSARSVLADATSALDTALASISSDLLDVKRLQANDQMTISAASEAQRAVELGTAARAGAGGDVIAALGALERAEHYLDSALERYRKDADRTAARTEKFNRRYEHVRARINTVQRQIDSMRGILDAPPRAQIAEASRQLAAAHSERERNLDLASEHLTDAEVLVERVVATLSSRSDDYQGFGGGIAGGMSGTSSGDLATAILGGIFGGAVSGRGGGWGGSSGGFGGSSRSRSHSRPSVGGRGIGGGGRF